MSPSTTSAYDMQEFGDFVFDLRITSGLSQEQVGRRGKLSADTVRRIEQGKHSPSLDTLVRLAAGLGTTVAALVSRVAATREEA